MGGKVVLKDRDPNIVLSGESCQVSHHGKEGSVCSLLILNTVPQGLARGRGGDKEMKDIKLERKMHNCYG